MPLLGAFFGTLFGGLLAWLAQYVTKKVAWGVAATVTYAAFTGALYLAMRTALSQIEAQLTGIPAVIVQAVQFALPPVAPFCLGLYATVWVACTVFVWQRDLLKVTASAA